MASWLPSIPYPTLKAGYWEPHTATLDWCEEREGAFEARLITCTDATGYCAEIVNSITNLLFIYLAFVGMINCYRNKHDRIFFITFFGYLIVGSGSFAFHTTLKYPMQLVDELSMIYTTCLMAWATFEHKKPLVVKWIVGFLVFGLALFITLYYHYLQDPTFHQNAYAVLTAVVLIRSMYIMEMNIRPHFRKRRAKHEQVQASSIVSEETKLQEKRDDDRDRWILQQMWTMIAFGLTVFLGGFAIWNLDNVFCSTIRSWRHELGLPWGLLLEGHGWWHIGTGLGAYYYIVWGIWLRHVLNGKQEQYDLRWPGAFTSIPHIVLRDTTANGSTKKTL